MIVRKNPPSFILVDKSTGEVVYTKRATGVGSEAIRKCVERGRALAARTGRIYFVYLDIMGARIGSKISVPMAYSLGITEEISSKLQREATKNCPHCGASYIGTPQMHKFECPPQGGGQGMYKENPGRVRKNVYTFNNPPSGPADPTAARELELYIDNDADLYRQQFVPIVKNLMLKRRKGVYNRELAVKLFMYLMDAGAKKYVREFGTGGHIDTMFNRNTRMAAARAFRDSFETEAELGNYDRMIGPVSNPRNYYSKGVREAVQDAINRQLEFKGKYIQGGARAQILKRTDNLVIGHEMSPHDAAYQAVSEYVSGVRRNPGVRKNIFTLNNPRQRPHNEMERGAALVGLLVTTWAPGDGVTRYRFFPADGKNRYADYHQGGALYTANGRKDAIAFIKAYGVGRSRMNPLNRSEVSQVVNMSRDVARTAIRAKKLGDASRAKANLAYGRGMLDTAMTFSPRGARKGVSGMLDRYNTIERRESSRRNPGACSNPVVRGDKLPLHLQQEVLRRFIYRWTTGNTQRVRVWKGISGKPTIPLISDEQWLREHAFHVTRDGKLDARHSHAEPHYMADDHVRPNPLLQTILLANPPISAQWDRLTGRQRIQILGFVGFEDTASRYVRLPWKLLSDMVKQALEQYWNDSSVTRGTTRRRMASASANPLTRQESANILNDARSDIGHAKVFVPGPTRASYAGRAIGRAQVVEKYGPKSLKRTTTQRTIAKAVALAHGASSVHPNPGAVRLPRPGTKMTVSAALELARRIGDRGLIEQCQKALKLQKAANKDAKCVIWKTFAMGSKDKIDSVVALTHYGDSPETMYKPPKGSKKGNHMYRHTWGEKGGKKSVPLLASADGKMLLMPLEGRKVAGDWLRH